MNKIFIGGLGALSDFYSNHPCNVNLKELIINPSMFLWTDKLVLSKRPYDKVKSGNEKTEKIITMMLNKLEDNKMLEVVDYSKVYDKKVFDEIYDKSEKEVDILSKNVEEKCDDGKEIPKMINYNGCQFCAPMIASIYSSIKIASDNNMTCVLNMAEKEYLNNFVYKKNKYFDYNMLFNEIISTELPVFDEMFRYLFVKKELCIKCTNEKKCESKCLKESSQCFDKILKLHDYGAMYKLREIIDSIIESKDQVCNEKDISDMKKQFNEKKEFTEKLLHKYLPKIKKWSNISVILGSPLCIISKMPPIVSVAPGVVSAVTDYIIGKSNWISIVDDIRNIKKYIN